MFSIFFLWLFHRKTPYVYGCCVSVFQNISWSNLDPVRTQLRSPVVIQIRRPIPLHPHFANCLKVPNSWNGHLWKTSAERTLRPHAYRFTLNVLSSEHRLHFMNALQSMGSSCMMWLKEAVGRGLGKNFPWHGIYPKMSEILKETALIYKGHIDVFTQKCQLSVQGEVLTWCWR